MEGGGHDSGRDETAVDSADLDPSATVVVSAGDGERFHRPNRLGYETTCKTRFERGVRYLSIAAAEREGYSPCAKPGCFG